MTKGSVSLMDDADSVRLALSPIRRRLLELLREPNSATGAAKQLGLPRQQIGYHLKALEQAGLVGLVEERARRGFTERLLVARADAFVVDPAVLSPGRALVDAQDNYAAEHLGAAAAGVVRDVARMRAAAAEEGRRLLTFTLESEVALAAPGDLERLCERLTAAFAEIVAEFDRPKHGRRYRLVLGALPAPHDRKPPQIN